MECINVTKTGGKWHQKLKESSVMMNVVGIHKGRGRNEDIIVEFTRDLKSVIGCPVYLIERVL